MPKLKSYPIFISHVWSRSSDYERLSELLSDHKRFKFRNYSVPQDRRFARKSESQLEASLRRQIRPAKSVLIIAGMYTKHRKWIHKEIEIALEMDKNIIVVSPHGSQRLPRELQVFNHQVKWNTKNIVNAIRKPKSNSENTISEYYKLASEGPFTTQESWQEDIAYNPDFAALQDWLEDPDAEFAKVLSKRTKQIERRRGVSG